GVAMRFTAGEDGLRQVENLQIPVEAIVLADADERRHIARVANRGLRPVDLLDARIDRGISEQRRQPRVHEVGVERAGEMNVLVAEGEGESAQELAERKRNGMIEQRLDRRRVEAKTAEQRVKLADLRGKLGVEMRCRFREHEGVLERKAAGFADELREKAGQAS